VANKGGSIKQVLKNRLTFYEQAFKEARQVGAFSFTSNAVCDALIEPIKRRDGKPLRVVELGAGTGAITRAVLKKLQPGDHFDVYEINSAFAKILREEFGAIKNGPSIEILETDVELIPSDVKYDVIVSSLPLMNFPPDKVRRVFDILADRLTPDGIICYYDYWAKEVRTVIGNAAERQRTRGVVAATRDFHGRMKYRRKIIFRNIPPARVHYLQKV
jgi:phospholipid N-methyltransferase